MKKNIERTDLPERLQYTKYYEHDGMLRAYANRAMVLAIVFALIATASLGFAIYPDAGRSPAQLFERADYALYFAKEHRRGGCWSALPPDQNR